MLPVLKESVAFPKPLIEKKIHTFIFLSYKILCFVSDMYSAPYKRITSSTFILHCLLFWKNKSRCLYFEPDQHHCLSKKCNFHCNQKDKPDRFVRLRYDSVPSNSKIKQTVPQMVPFCRIFVTPLEGHVHLCDKNPLRERKAITIANWIEKKSVTDIHRVFQKSKYIYTEQAFHASIYVSIRLFYLLFSF